MKPRWTIYLNSAGRWAVKQSDRVASPSFDLWADAVSFVRSGTSRWVVNDVLNRAVDVAANGEYEGVAAIRIDARTLHRKIGRIQDAARYRRLSITIAVEEESDPTETTIHIRVKGRLK